MYWDSGPSCLLCCRIMSCHVVVALTHTSRLLSSQYEKQFQFSAPIHSSAVEWPGPSVKGSKPCLWHLWGLATLMPVPCHAMHAAVVLLCRPSAAVPVALVAFVVAWVFLVFMSGSGMPYTPASSPVRTLGWCAELGMQILLLVLLVQVRD
jgi:hypothetical protein